MDAKKLGKKIKLARVELDMTQVQLAEAIDSMQRNISRYEKGIALPSLPTLEKLAKTLKKPVGYFFDEELVK
jgi:transcriptional regulator with XRE-family HTH domain